MLKDFTKEKFDIIIQAGQSNSDGTGFGKSDEPYQVNENVWYMNGDFTMTLACEAVNGNEIQSNYSLSFVREYLRAGYLDTGRKLLILRTSVGGTGFLEHHWGMTDPLYLRMMEMTRTALELNPENRLIALLWHQGENDAACGATFDEHYANLIGLVNSVKDTFGVPELPFIAGDFVQDWKNEFPSLQKYVPNAIRKVCADVVNGRFVETDGLPSNAQENGMIGDSVHFSRNSLYKLGVRYFKAYTEVRN